MTARSRALLGRSLSSIAVALLGAMAVAAPLAAQAAVSSSLGAGTPTAAGTSARIADVRYEVAFDRETARRREARVTTTFTVAGSEPVLLSLPAWTPGAYELSFFAANVRNFGATADGRALPWDKVDHDTWRIRADGVREVTVRFDYRADSLDNAMAWSRPDFLLFNGTNLFLYPEGQPLDFAAQMTIRTEPDWKVATGMRWTGRGTTYAAANYHDLVDMPTFIGRFDLDSSMVAGKWMRLATYPMRSFADNARAMLWDALRKMVPPQAAVFGEAVAPWEHYTTMIIADSSYQGASGLEHQNSHVDIITPAAIGTPFLNGLYAHEIFHAWNVKRVRPTEIFPYRYDVPQPTTLLWVSEGITDYYADLSLVRAGLIPPAGFYELTSGKIGEVSAVPAVALEDASLSTWIHPTDGTGYIYYPKGSLAGFMLDVLIRDASNNARSLDTVMRELYETRWKQGRGFTAADFWAAVVRAAGESAQQRFADFNARYVDGREAYPWAEILPLAGLRGTQEKQPRLGTSTEQGANGVVVTEIAPGSAAAAAGVQVGDVLVSVGSIAVDDPQFGVKFRAQYAKQSEGAPLVIRVRRGGQTLTLNGRLRFVEGPLQIVEDPGASAKARAVREGILRGTTAGR